MGSVQKLLISGLCLTATVLLASCDTVEIYHVHKHGPGIGHGPPAHAKAYGYRKQACGYDLVYDASCGMYVVIGISDCYYHDGYFYRLYDDGWQISVSADNDWHAVDYRTLPPGLRNKTKIQGKHKGTQTARSHFN